MNQTPVRTQLDEESWFDFFPDWLTTADADALLDRFLARPSWGERAIIAFGNPVMQPRLVDWEGDVAYRYSGQVLEPRPWSPDVRALVDRVRETTGADFNHALFNLYRDGRDSVAMHSDNEPELGILPLVASLSFGATRRFHMESRRNRASRRALDLTHGSLLVMGGAMQRRWRHAVPKQPGVSLPRVNLTLRELLGPPGWRDPRWGQRPPGAGGGSSVPA